jgi:hypothetical protein
MCLFHKWSKWEQYKEEYTYIAGRIAPKNVQGKSFQASEDRQKRVCLKCNKVQDERIT